MKNATFGRIEADRPGILSNRHRKNLGTIGLILSKVARLENAIFEGIKPNVLGFFRVGFRFERIPGRSA